MKTTKNRYLFSELFVWLWILGLFYIWHVISFYCTISQNLLNWWNINFHSYTVATKLFETLLHPLKTVNVLESSLVLSSEVFSHFGKAYSETSHLFNKINKNIGKLKYWSYVESLYFPATSWCLNKPKVVTPHSVFLLIKWELRKRTQVRTCASLRQVYQTWVYYMCVKSVVFFTLHFWSIPFCKCCYFFMFGWIFIVDKNKIIR